MLPGSHLAYLQGIEPAESNIQDSLLSCGDLPPFLRALLVADGTVTLLLQAYFGESIVVDEVVQETLTLERSLPLLGMQPGDTALCRRVVLKGVGSHRVYAGAFSLLNPSRIHPDLFTQLIDERVGMGEVLRNAARGSFREVLDIGRESEQAVRRTYAVFVEQQPAILITETFDIEVFEDRQPS